MGDFLVGCSSVRIGLGCFLTPMRWNINGKKEVEDIGT